MAITNFECNLDKLTTIYRMAYFDNYCRKYISEGLSLMAVDTDTKELVGLACNTLCKRE